ncbi:MAG: hypothetical protein COZ09_01555 [Comamonadaceae bacterium CG_4_10_14_3_um_filter_60_42]|nr:MAG: hypothetical protein COZ09_01555 [Comamonadaceae bacterium CG_4_10_14_3_um_filter_60_42]
MSISLYIIKRALNIQRRTTAAKAKFGNKSALRVNHVTRIMPIFVRFKAMLFSVVKATQNQAACVFIIDFNHGQP